MWSDAMKDDVVGALVDALRAEGLEVQREDDGSIVIGPEHRGDRADPVALRLRHHDVVEYLGDLATGRDAPDPTEYAFGMLLMLLVEALTTVHDGEKNLVTEVELRRGADGRLGLHETRLDSGPPALPPGGPYGWTAQRPS